jgi:hypothetical protein
VPLFLSVLALGVLVAGIVQIVRPDTALLGHRWALRDGRTAELSENGRAMARLAGAVSAVLAVLVVLSQVGVVLRGRDDARAAAEDAAVLEVWGMGRWLGGDVPAADRLRVLAADEVPVTVLDTEPAVPEHGLFTAEVRYGVVGSPALDPFVTVGDQQVVDLGDLAPGTLVVGVFAETDCELAEIQVAQSPDRVVITPVFRWSADHVPHTGPWDDPDAGPEPASTGCGSMLTGSRLDLVPVTLQQPLGVRTVIDGRTGDAAEAVRSDP